MKSNKPTEIAKILKEATKINVYDKRRTLEVVDVRSLYCYILSNDLKYRSVQIRDIIRKHRPYDHATVLYNVRIYNEDVRYRRPDLEEIRLHLVNQFSPYFTMIKKANAITDEQLMLEIINLIDNYENTKQEGVAVFDQSSN